MGNRHERHLCYFAQYTQTSFENITDAKKLQGEKREVLYGFKSFFGLVRFLRILPKYIQKKGRLHCNLYEQQIKADQLKIKFQTPSPRDVNLAYFSLFKKNFNFCSK